MTTLSEGRKARVEGSSFRWIRSGNAVDWSIRLFTCKEHKLKSPASKDAGLFLCRACIARRKVGAEARPAELRQVGALSTVAGFAEQLEVASGIGSTSRKRDDMIKFQLLLALALYAFSAVPLPDKELHL